MSAATKRNRFRSGYYDINGFISQLLASSKFDELAEKLAEKAAERIMHMKEDQAPEDRANDDSEVHNNTETATENTQTESGEKHEKEHLRKGFAGTIDAKAVMNESISISENLLLKYNVLKKKAVESKIQKEKDTVTKNVTNEEGKENMTMEPDVDENKEKEGQPASENTTQRNEDDVKKGLNVERDVTKDEDQKVEPERNIEPYFVHNSPDGERNESSQKNYEQPEEPNPAQDEGEKIFRVKYNSAAQSEEQEAIKADNGIKDEIPSSLDEQNRNYSPSDENETNAGAEVERIEDEPQKRGQEEITEVGHGAYFRGREDSVEENVVPWSEMQNPYGGIDRSVGSNDSGATGGRGSHERFPEDQRSTENENVDPAKPVNRTEGDKVYTYNQDPDYQDYHEKMAQWRKKHPENPAEFL